MADFEILVIGAGPGGYVAAIRSAQLGFSTAIVERETVGGICLNWGCIPSKSLLRNAEVLNLVKDAEKFGISFDNLSYDFGKAIDRSRQVVRRLTTGVGYLLKKNNVEHIVGSATFVDAHTIQIGTATGENRTVSAENIIIATGARQREIPTLPIDHNVVITSRDALEMREIPNRVVVIGGGATGAEFSHVYRSYGSEVTIVELMDRIVPNEDQEISEVLDKSFRDQGIESRTSASVEAIEINGDIATVKISENGNNSVIECDKVLVAVGVQGNTDGIGLEQVGVATDRTFITVGENLETNVSGVYAIGDVTGRMLLAHVASAQAVTAIEYIAGLNPPQIDYSLMPRAIYCKPQVASFGLTESQARDQGINIKVGKFPFTASGKAIALGETDGMVKLVVDEEIGEIIGAHMIGAEVTELLGELSITKMLEGTATELGWLVHPHPTISEMIKEAALDTVGEAIHV
ncbi:MAG: dihydrolipoyl dehydrogenase [SAR202 cluster bacterium]|nr:dihydrolipoyl dehydrogenase [Chloroflexota bacterium]MDP7626918.1 dihydrolipoyl dehydrogenase [SAR202 cluster bacterium]MQG02896.1 dihydrolipoyl dehydrogenase [SAR202 cluster bacterium]HAE32257.1 dihydrolipoyl dehydrogenase [Dehalococcoidia bacterium]